MAAIFHAFIILFYFYFLNLAFLGLAFIKTIVMLLIVMEEIVNGLHIVIDCKSVVFDVTMKLVNGFIEG